MKTEILRMLKSTGDYLSGQQLCEMLGVSRTAVWKAVGELICNRGGPEQGIPSCGRC